jgi:hypothetical protein
MTRAIAALALVALAVGAVAPAAAHHGWSGYNSSQALDVRGVISESGYEHPHGYVRIEATGRTWVVVLAPPSRMERRGLPRATLAFHVRAFRSVRAWDVGVTTSGAARLAATASLLLWTGVVACGRLIAYF